MKGYLSDISWGSVWTSFSEDLPGSEKLPRHQQQFRCAALARVGTGQYSSGCHVPGITPLLLQMQSHGKWLVGRACRWCRLGHSGTCCKNVLQPFHQSSALWPRSSPLESGAGGPASHSWTLPRAARTFIFICFHLLYKSKDDAVSPQGCGTSSFNPNCQGIFLREAAPRPAGQQVLHAAAFPEFGVCVLDR